MTTIEEYINKLNKYCAEHDICDIEDTYEYPELNELVDKLEYIESIERDEHRWYVLALNAYKVSLDGADYFVGVWEVETLKSECMSVNDCGIKLDFFEMKEVITTTYRKK